MTDATAERKIVVELKGVWLSFSRPVLEDISLAAYESETLLIVGESGTGKTTILKLILRLLLADRGKVYVKDQEVSELSFGDALNVRRQMGMVFQGSALFDSLSVFENVAYALREHTKMSESEIDQRVREKLAFVDLDADEVRDLLPSALSGGMRKRVGIARALSNDPEVMLYDEPTAGLDPLTTGTIVRLIQKLQRELGVTTIIVSHDLRATLPIADRVALIRDQRIAFIGTPKEMLDTRDEYIQAFLGAD
jgi:phospholipid/cholesterol/gamma-HCH transport system ATP-binding protein